MGQLKRQKGTRRSNEVYVLAPAGFRAKVRGTKYRKANDSGDRDLAREAKGQHLGARGWISSWRCVTSLPAQVYLVDSSRNSDEALFCAPPRLRQV
jgi:hypothetical protein